MVRRCHSPTGCVAAANRPVLVECCDPLDRRSIGTNGLVNVVATSIAGHTPDMSEAGTWIVRAKIFRNVVLDQWVGGPAIDGEVSITIGSKV